MGTSQSSNGPNGRSPLVPAWADSDPGLPQSEPVPARFKDFRQSLGRFVAGGDYDDLTHAVGHYARKATGGANSAARRMGSVARAGAALFGALAGTPAAPGEPTVDIASLTGLPCEVAISVITQALATGDGDTDKIRAAMNRALTDALDDIEIFDANSITDDVLIDTLIGYVSESVFLQIIMDSAKAWNKAENPTQAMRAETALRELIRVVVDKYMTPMFGANVRSLTQRQVQLIERSAIIETWQEWENYP